jgi:hypothetical protein
VAAPEVAGQKCSCCSKNGFFNARNAPIVLDRTAFILEIADDHAPPRNVFSKFLARCVK